MPKKRENVSHTPVWVAAPLKIDREGNTRPGFLCIHELENGNGLCGSSTWSDEDTMSHSCMVMLRGRWNISRPCYDKPRRCPGWAGGGWKHAEYVLCYEREGQSGYVSIDFENPWWRWKTHKCTSCGVVVLPYVIIWTSWRTWWYEFKYARNSWMWFINLETWWRRRGRW